MSQVYLDAVVEPPRSLSRKGFDRLMLTLGVLSFAMGCVFILIKAYPVAGFMGLDVLAVWLIFRAHFRKQGARTYLRVTADAIEMRKVDAKGHERRAQLPAHFARVEYDRSAPGPRALSLSHAGRRYAIGEHLTHRERESLARRLGQALDQARRERHG